MSKGAMIVLAVVAGVAVVGGAVYLVMRRSAYNAMVPASERGGGLDLGAMFARMSGGRVTNANGTKGPPTFGPRASAVSDAEIAALQSRALTEAGL